MALVFYGTQIRKGQPAQYQPPQGYVITLTMLALEAPDAGSAHRVYIRTSDLDENEVTCLLATLRPVHNEQVRIETTLGWDSPFELSVDGGGGCVHVSGYIQPGPRFTDEDEDGDSGDLLGLVNSDDDEDDEDDTSDDADGAEQQSSGDDDEEEEGEGGAVRLLNGVRSKETAVRGGSEQDEEAESDEEEEEERHEGPVRAQDAAKSQGLKRPLPSKAAGLDSSSGPAVASPKKKRRRRSKKHVDGKK